MIYTIVGYYLLIGMMVGMFVAYQLVSAYGWDYLQSDIESRLTDGLTFSESGFKYFFVAIMIGVMAIVWLPLMVKTVYKKW